MNTTKQHLNRLEISRSALLDNHRALQELHTYAAICPVLKSNAYGHGIEPVISVLDTCDFPFYVVDSIEEAQRIHLTGTKKKTLILGYTPPQSLQSHDFANSEIAIFDLISAQILNQNHPGTHVHIFLDSGLSREGILIEQFAAYLDQILLLPNITIDGLVSHLADADNASTQEFTAYQLDTYKLALQIMSEKGIFPQWRHLTNSAGSIKVSDPVFTLSRVGLASYGITPLEEVDGQFATVSLQPVARFLSTVGQIKTISPNSSVGYSRTFVATQPTTIALIPAGYYEGIDRRLSNKGVVKIRQTFCPILGRVSMNMCVVDVSHIPDLLVGEEVEVYSNMRTDPHSLEKSAHLCETIPYELLVHLPETLKRIVVQ